jgi:hypothetical protein
LNRLQDSAVSRHPIARFQVDDVARNQLSGRNLLLDTMAFHHGKRGKHVPQGI